MAKNIIRYQWQTLAIIAFAGSLLFAKISARSEKLEEIIEPKNLALALVAISVYVCMGILNFDRKIIDDLPQHMYRWASYSKVLIGTMLGVAAAFLLDTNMLFAIPLILCLTAVLEYRNHRRADIYFVKEISVIDNKSDISGPLPISVLKKCENFLLGLTISSKIPVIWQSGFSRAHCQFVRSGIWLPFTFFCAVISSFPIFWTDHAFILSFAPIIVVGLTTLSAQNSEDRRLVELGRWTQIKVCLGESLFFQMLYFGFAVPFLMIILIGKSLNLQVSLAELGSQLPYWNVLATGPLAIFYIGFIKALLPASPVLQVFILFLSYGEEAAFPVIATIMILRLPSYRYRSIL